MLALIIILLLLIAVIYAQKIDYNIGSNEEMSYLITTDYGYSRVMCEPFASAIETPNLGEQITFCRSKLKVGCEVVSPTSGYFTQYWGSMDGKYFYNKTLIELNPPIVIEDINIDGKTLHIVRDDLLIAGTKQRMVEGIGRSLSRGKKYIYAGPCSGVAQVALALIGSYYKLDITYITKVLTDLSLKAMTFGLKFVISNSVTTTYNECMDTGNYIALPLGLKGFETQLGESIKASMQGRSGLEGRVWCVIGTGTLEQSIRLASNGLATTIKVQVGYDNKDATHVVDLQYLDHARIMPPYPSISTYDAKLWELVLQHSQDGDFVWNVARSAKKYLQFYPELSNLPRYIYVKDIYDPESIIQTLNFDDSYVVTTDFKVKYIDKISFQPPSICLDFNSDKLMTESIFTDYFVEHIRLKVERQDKPSAYKIIAGNKFKSLISKRIKITPRHELPYLMRYALNDLRSNYCNTFPYGPAMYVFNKHKPIKVLDMCAGWGDRMVAAYLSDVQYYLGVDPNSNLDQAYKSIAKTLKDSNHNTNNTNFDAKVIISAFEDVELTEMFDLMFTSPPYFIMEKYSNDKEQSCNRYKTVDAWLKGFMFPSIYKVYKHLNDGGHMVMCITDTYSHNFCDKMFKYAVEIGFTYVGSEAYRYTTAGRTITQPFVTFVKLETKEFTST